MRGSCAIYIPWSALSLLRCRVDSIVANAPVNESSPLFGSTESRLGARTVVLPKECSDDGEVAVAVA